MANDKQLKLKTYFIGTRGVKEYRESIQQWVNKDDVVLEIGCEFGVTTRCLADRAKEVIGTDISLEVVERARKMFPGIRFETLDGFDVLGAQAFGKTFTKIYIDISGISGYRSLLDVIALLNMYATMLRPAAIVVKSGALKHFAAHCVAWNPSTSGAPEQETSTEDPQETE